LSGSAVYRLSTARPADAESPAFWQGANPLASTGEIACPFKGECRTLSFTKSVVRLAVVWRLEDRSGPYSAPWDGKDAVGWIWEIYRDDESRRVRVDVSGTAMAIADEFLPMETAEARRTHGRSEVEKILEAPNPPRRISLGTTGYLDAQAPQPDAVLVDINKHPIAVVEVRSPSVLTLPDASVIRDRFAAAIPARFFLIVSQARGYLFTKPDEDYQPLAELNTFDVVLRYYPLATEHQPFKGTELNVIFHQWLRDLVEGREVERVGAERTLDDVGFLDAIRGATLTTGAFS
jgi:hypothetical protein